MDRVRTPAAAGSWSTSRACSSATRSGPPTRNGTARSSRPRPGPPARGPHLRRADAVHPGRHAPDAGRDQPADGRGGRELPGDAVPARRHSACRTPAGAVRASWPRPARCASSSCRARHLTCSKPCGGTSPATATPATAGCTSCSSTLRPSCRSWPLPPEADDPGRLNLRPLARMPLLGPLDPVPGCPQRILVAGTSGSGKTSLAARIGELLHLPAWRSTPCSTGRAGYRDRPSPTTSAAWSPTRPGSRRGRTARYGRCSLVERTWWSGWT